MKPLSENQATVLRETLARNGVAGVRVFGSVARGQANEGSDLDLLLDPVPGMTLVHLARLKAELDEALGMKADLAFQRALPPRIAAAVLKEARPLQ